MIGSFTVDDLTAGGLTTAVFTADDLAARGLAARGLMTGIFTTDDFAASGSTTGPFAAGLFPSSLLAGTTLRITVVCSGGDSPSRVLQYRLDLLDSRMTISHMGERFGCALLRVKRSTGRPRAFRRCHRPCHGFVLCRPGPSWEMTRQFTSFIQSHVRCAVDLV